MAVCGIGKVFAAICTEAMILRYAPSLVLNSGVGGTLTPALSIGDIAVATSLVQHDMDTSALGDPVGLISGINKIYFEADKDAVARLCAAADKVGARTLCGTIASGDRFLADAAHKRFIADTFGAVACEMEGAAVAQVAYVNHTPFAVMRAISDSASGDATMIIRNTLLYNIAFIILTMIFGCAVGICLAEVFSKAVQRVSQTLILLPQLISMVIVAYIVYGFLSTSAGWVNKGLLNDANINWYGVKE